MNETGTTQEAEVVEAEVIEQVAGTELAPAPPASAGGGEVATLWNTHDPSEIVERASAVATALKQVIDKQQMKTPMGGGREHVNIEGWQTAGTLLGLQAIVTATRRIEPAASFEVKAVRKKWGKENGKRVVIEETEHTWTVVGYSSEAVAEVRTMDGRVVSRAEATCSREESKWFDSDEYAVKSMAQTRACSRALRQALGFIIGMAGYATTPAEEMPADNQATPSRDHLAKATPEQNEAVSTALCQILPHKEAEATYNAVCSLFDGTMPGQVAEAIGEVIKAYRALNG